MEFYFKTASKIVYNTQISYLPLDVVVGNHKRKNNVKRQQDKKDSKLWSGNIVRNENEIAALSRWYCNQRYKGYIMLSQASKKKKKKNTHAKQQEINDGYLTESLESQHVDNC